MADPKYIDLLRQGAAAWNAWRSENPKETADLSGLNPTRADYSGDTGALALVDFAGLKLAPANLAGATLRRVNLAGADLAGVNLSDAFITGSLLRTTKLAGALLARSRIRDSNLDYADLRGADLNGADIQGCSMCRTGLQEATLGGTILRDCLLEGADLQRAWLLNTAFLDLDLGGVHNLDAVTHVGQSQLSTDTLIRSLRGRDHAVESFLAKTGVPVPLIAAAGSVELVLPTYSSCFISHSSKDEAFAQHLTADLRQRGVKCWHFPDSARWGDPTWGTIGTGIADSERLLLVASKHSLRSPAVMRELERSLQREDELSQTVLLPITLDDYVFRDWQHPRASDVRSKTIGDFRRWNEPSSYAQAIERLLSSLRADRGRAGSPQTVPIGNPP